MNCYGLISLFLFVHQAFQMLLSLELLKAVVLTDFVFLLYYSSQYRFTLAIDSYFSTLRALTFSLILTKSYLFSVSSHFVGSPQVDRKPEKFRVVLHY